MLIRFRQDAKFEQLLKKQCALRAPLFSAEHERKGLLTIVQSVLSARQLS
jgi:hypothetical protein